MSPKVRKYSPGIRVDRAEQGTKRIVKTDNKNRRADRLQVLRYKTHPKLFACTDDEDSDEQDNQIAFKPEKVS